MPKVIGKGPDPWKGNVDALERAGAMRARGQSVTKIRAMLVADFGIDIAHRTLARHLLTAEKRAVDIRDEVMARAESVEGRARVMTAATAAIEELAAEPIRQFTLYSKKFEELMESMSAKGKKSPTFVLGVGRLALDWFRLGASMAKVVPPDEDDDEALKAALLAKVSEHVAAFPKPDVIDMEVVDANDATKH